MKSVKYTLAALAMIALASVSTVKAANPGDVILGAFNSTNSLEFDLGAYNTLTGSLPTGLSWDLGNVTGIAGSGLSFSFAAAATSLSAKAGIPATDIAVAGLNITTPTSSTTGEEGNITTVVTSFANGGTAETPLTDGATYTEELVSSSTPGNYASKDNGNGFGLGENIDATWTGNDTENLYLLGNGTDTLIGTFTTKTTGSDTVLTFSAAATPEPSAYALGLCAVALFFVLKRRSKVA